jgi:hypothetical protein
VGRGGRNLAQPGAGARAGASAGPATAHDGKQRGRVRDDAVSMGPTRQREREGETVPTADGAGRTGRPRGETRPLVGSTAIRRR